MDELTVLRGGLAPQLPERSSVTVERLVAAWLAGKKASTLYGYRRDMLAFADHVGVGTVEAAAGRLLAGHHGDANALALEWRNAMVADDYAPATINRRLSALRSMVELAQTLGHVGWTLNVKNVKSKPYRDTRGPGTAGAMAILDHLRKREDAQGRRDVAIFHLLWDLALRKAEIAALDLASLDVSTSRLTVMRKWTNEATIMSLPASTLHVLQAWIAARGEVDSPALFTNAWGGRLSSRAVHRLVREAGAAVGVKAWPHGIRHAAVTQALEDTGGDLRKVQKFSGHTRMDTLMIYDDARRDFQGEVADGVAAHAVKKDQAP